MLSGEFKAILARQRYGLVGGHSAVKPCLWLRRALRGEGHCYKERFYGIESHRCMQMTPAVGWCMHRCLFCWRNTDYTIPAEMESWDGPEDVIEGCLAAHRQAVSGFGGDADRRLYQEARKPKHAALSLAGEPLTYPPMGELIGGFKRRGMTTYLVTNGTLPARLAALTELPTQLYLSLVAPDRQTHVKVSQPATGREWDGIMETLGLMRSLDAPSVVRLTLVKGVNMHDPRGYARLISLADPDYVEVKAFMLVGGSRRRLTPENMPSHQEIRDFAGELAVELSYRVRDEMEDSRVVQLTGS